MTVLPVFRPKRGRIGRVGREPETPAPFRQEVELDAPPVIVGPEDPKGGFVGDRQRPEQHRADYAAEGNGGAKPERQRGDPKRREGRPTAELAEGVPQIGAEVLDQAGPPTLASRLLVGGPVAEPDPASQKPRVV